MVLTDKLPILPLLRWAGSKRKLLRKLSPYWTADYERYIEPFAGSAALFFALRPPRAILNDINTELIQALSTIRDNPNQVYEELLQFRVNESTYYRLRSLNSSLLSATRRAARFFFLNRFCFNGIYRTNLAGHFNVPFAAQKTRKLPSWDQFSASAESLKSARFLIPIFFRQRE